MQSSPNTPAVVQDLRREWPHLAALRLSPDELQSLRRQGFVCDERRGTRHYFKLRFRCNGRQHVRYIGDEEAARAVAIELKSLQAHRRQSLKLRKSQRKARELMRSTKMALTPIVEDSGFKFHGQAIRRPRASRA